MTFYDFMQKTYKTQIRDTGGAGYEDEPDTLLACDMSKDTSFPRNVTNDHGKWHGIIRQHLVAHGGDVACLIAFEHCWRMYLRTLADQQRGRTTL